MRALAEGISREFAPRLERTALVLYDRDPEHLQAQWYVTPQTLAEARDLFPGEGSEPRRVLRLCRLDPDGRTEVVANVPQGTDDSEAGGQSDFVLRGDGAEYICELGLESETGGWLLLARSNRIRPADRNPPAPCVAPVLEIGPIRNVACGPAEEPEGFDDVPVEAALAAVGGSLYPVFPDLEPDVPLPGHFPSLEETPVHGGSGDRGPELMPDIPLPGHFPSLGETPVHGGSEDRGPGVPAGVPGDFAPRPEPMTEEALFDADLAAMPPPLLPSSPDPGVSPAGAEMPGPFYDPRAALSSAVLGGLGLSPSDGIRAELIVQGEAPPGSTVDLLGQPVPVDSDGRFYARCSIGDPARLSLAIDGRPPPRWETAG
ncbi:MAG: DUF4912 domain-containing protein [Candidatus Thiosymbion ectosymbiont of Robbea hypermnestra]|nr:DUF4912 domain-containing protein [Candidatus Thiosymbion ectosymbiont of Robbea hypermnestra]